MIKREMLSTGDVHKAAVKRFGADLPPLDGIGSLITVAIVEDSGSLDTGSGSVRSRQFARLWVRFYGHLYEPRINLQSRAGCQV